MSGGAANRGDLNLDRSSGDFHYAEDYAYDAGVGLNADVVRYISKVKGEEPWLLEFRLKALEQFEKMKNPTHWASKKLDELDFSKIRYYLAKGEKRRKSWDEVPEDVKMTFERLGVPEQERAFLAGVEAQFDSESAYSNMKAHLEKDGVIFVDSTEGLKKYPEIFRKYFGKIIPITDNKYSALNSAVFSGGSFIYVPKGVKVKQPLQAYFRINAESFGQFERTLIIADEGAELMYMEGCTAPRFETGTLHSAVVELVALRGAKIQYVTVQNWSDNVFNLVTKRGMAEEDAQIRWVDCNIGSGITMKYPAVVLRGERARGERASLRAWKPSSVTYPRFATGGSLRSSAFLRQGRLMTPCCRASSATRISSGSEGHARACRLLGSFAPRALAGATRAPSRGRSGRSPTYLPWGWRLPSTC